MLWFEMVLARTNILNPYSDLSYIVQVRLSFHSAPHPYMSTEESDKKNAEDTGRMMFDDYEHFAVTKYLSGSRVPFRLKVFLGPSGR